MSRSSGAPLSRMTTSGGHAGRSAPCPLVRGPQLCNGNVERSGQSLRNVFGQCSLTTFDTADHRSTDPCLRTKLRLRKTQQNPPVTRKALRDRDIHKVGDGNFKNGRNPRQDVNLRRCRALLPPSDGCNTDVGKPCQIRLRPAGVAPRAYQAGRGKPAHYSPTHRKDPAAHVVTGRHCAALSLRCAHTIGFRRSLLYDRTRATWGSS